MIALVLLVLSSVLIGGVWPLVLQQVVVGPNAITKEHDVHRAKHQRDPAGLQPDRSDGQLLQLHPDRRVQG